MGSFPEKYNDPSLFYNFFSEIQNLTFSVVSLANFVIQQISLDKGPR